MGYVIAAFAIVIGSLTAYGLRIQAQRRALIRREREAHGAQQRGEGTGPC